ncbi:MAG: hypothetical protein NZM12_00380 [Steroidobacteraceae bacterium]|nr:hypothetical protein [Steroidobacteraceae bacterium]MDW8260517.1 hypothetical protein [Gammaproteobacteria bacterium]
MNEHRESEFERRAAALLAESAARLDGPTRSRLTQARYRALAAAQSASAWRRLLGRRSFGLLAPAGALAAAAVVATVLLLGRGGGSGGDVFGATADDFELLAEADVLELIVEDDPEFYEWALAQSGVGDAEELGS